MKIKFPHLLLASSLLVSSLNVSAAAASFTDVEPSAWYYDAVENVTENGWLNGTGGSCFTPNGNLTHAMLATILWRIEGSPAPNGSADFIDTDSTGWYADGLAWSVENGLFNGYPDGSFRPANAITREQLAAVFYRTAEDKTDIGVGAIRTKNGCSWASEACAWANAHGLFPYALGTLDLCAPASRAEIAYWLNAYYPQETQSTLTEGQYSSMGYLLYTPANAQANMPLIVYLHGGHGKSSDLSILTTTDGFPQYLADGTLGEIPAYVLIPQLPADQNGWKAADDTVMSLIDKICTENKIDRSRISLTGHSMGGTGTWDIALLHPEVFSRIAPMSGSIQTTAETLAALSDMPIWTFVGDADRVVKPESAEQFIAALQEQNANAKLTVFADTDHVGVLQTAWLEDGTALIDWLIQ